MKKMLQLKYESGYYWGLALLLLSCLSLVWALWRDAFRPEVFLVGLLAFSWGYALLWRHDLNQRFATLEAEVAALKADLALVTEKNVESTDAQEPAETIAPCETGAAEDAGGQTVDDPWVRSPSWVVERLESKIDETLDNPPVDDPIKD